MRHLPTVSDENLQCPAESKRCLRRNWSFLCSVISQGKVVALDRWGGQWNQLSMTHRLTTNCAKNYCNRTLIVKVIVENVVTCFLGHGVDSIPVAMTFNDFMRVMVLGLPSKNDRRCGTSLAVSSATQTSCTKLKKENFQTMKLQLSSLVDCWIWVFNGG